MRLDICARAAKAAHYVLGPAEAGHYDDGPARERALRTTHPVTTVPRLLIADDQRDVLEALRLLVKGEGYQADTVDSPAAALRALEQRDYDVVLIDLNYARDTTSGAEGLDLLTRIH